MVPKEGKISNSWQNHEVVPVPKQGGTGTTQQNQIGIGTDTSGIGTAINNVYGTGTKQSGIGTTVSKMPRFCSFAHLSPNSYTVSMGTLLND